MVRADDGSMVSDTTITFHLLNVNDAPRIDISGLEDNMMKIDEVLEIQILDIITDVDDPDDEIWVTASNVVPGAAQYNPITGILAVNWQEPGHEIVTITLEDRHGESSYVELMFDVVDDLPLEWDSELQVSVDTQDYGTNPTVAISNVGDLVLSDTSVIWTVCNSITGICHSSGTSYNLGPFIILPSSGEGLGAGDYFTLSVQAVDQDGFDRATQTQYKTFATKPSDASEGTPEAEQEPDSSSPSVVSMTTVGVLGLALLVCMALAIGLATALRRRDGDYDYDHYQDGYAPQPNQQAPLPKPPRPPGLTPPPPPTTIPLPPEGLPDGWTMEQWHYYGEEYLSRRK